jgi:hypothetical protein
MIGRAIRAAALGALLILPLGAAVAQAGQLIPIVPDPRKSYIFYRGADGIGMTFLREPDQERLAARAAALVEAREAYRRRLPVRLREHQDCRGSRVSGCANLEEIPPEPTAANFDSTPTAGDLAVAQPWIFGPGRGQRGFIAEVRPGTHIVYGEISSGQTGNVGVCLCMGSVRLDVAAGQLVDLGEIRHPRIAARQTGSEYRAGRVPRIELVPATASMVAPVGAAAQRVVPAVLRAAGKQPNHYGVEIDRLAPLPGILGYERDRVIDLRAAPAAPLAPAAP